MVFVVIFFGLFICRLIMTPLYEVVLGVIGIIAVFLMTYKIEFSKADNVVKATLIEEEAVYKEDIEHTGYSIGYSWRSRRDYYRYKKVIDHYDCTFKVVYKDGKKDEIKCRKDSALYNRLIYKPSEK